MQGRGYATAAVAGWAVAIRERELLPLYSTSWDNIASQRVARKLGMVLYGEDWSIE
jgi:RimJ/RimL family protein N-acetyltransferase